MYLFFLFGPSLFYLFSVVIVCFLCLRFCYCSCSFCCWCFYFISFLTGFSFSFLFLRFLGRVLLMLFYDVLMNVCKNCFCCYKTLFALILFPLTRFETINFIFNVFVVFFRISKIIYLNISTSTREIILCLFKYIHSNIFVLHKTNICQMYEKKTH